MRIVAALVIVLLFAGGVWDRVSARVFAQGPIVKQLQQPKSDWDTGYFKQATVGDFVSFDNLLKGTLLRRPEVVEVGDRQVTVDVTGLSGGKPMVMSRQILVFSGPDIRANQGTPKVSTVKVKVGERELTCELSEYRNADGKLTRRTWKSPQVSFGGLVKDEAYRVGPAGEEILTGGQVLTDFRFAKAPE